MNVADVVGRAIETNRPLIDAKRHELRSSSCRTQPVHVDGDVTRLTQVVGNLVHNAAKYTDDGGEIRVQVEASRPGGGDSRQGHGHRHPERHAG